MADADSGTPPGFFIFADAKIKKGRNDCRGSSGNSRGPLFALPQGKEKGPAASYSRAGGSRTTLGDGALDFRVRNGNGYDCLSMVTGPENGLVSRGLKRTTARGRERTSPISPLGEVL